LRRNGACVKPATDAEPARPHRRLDVDLEALDELRRVVERVAETLLRIAEVEVFKPPFTLPPSSSTGTSGISRTLPTGG